VGPSRAGSGRVGGPPKRGRGLSIKAGQAPEPAARSRPSGAARGDTVTGRRKGSLRGPARTNSWPCSWAIYRRLHDQVAGVGGLDSGARDSPSGPVGTRSRTSGAGGRRPKHLTADGIEGRVIHGAGRGCRRYPITRSAAADRPRTPGRIKAGGLFAVAVRPGTQKRRRGHTFAGGGQASSSSRGTPTAGKFLERVPVCAA